MKLEDIVCSLELAKRLKELRIRQDSFFWWQVATEKATHIIDEDAKIFISYNDEYWRSNPYPWQNHIWNSYSAYTAAELGEMLPGIIKIDDHELWFKSTKGLTNSYSVSYGSNHNGIVIYKNGMPATIDSKEENARAKMLIYLIENSLVSVEDLNK